MLLIHFNLKSIEISREFGNSLLSVMSTDMCTHFKII